MTDQNRILNSVQPDKLRKKLRIFIHSPCDRRLIAFTVSGEIKIPYRKELVEMVFNRRHHKHVLPPSMQQDYISSGSGMAVCGFYPADVHRCISHISGYCT